MKINLPKELTLNGTDNDGIRHRYSFDKNQKLKEGLTKLFIGLGFEEKTITDFIKKIFNRTLESEEEIETVILKPEEINDRIYYIKNSKYEIDLFFGKDKVIILVRTKKSRETLVDEIEKKSSWISKEEIEKRSKKKENKLRTSIKVK